MSKKESHSPKVKEEFLSICQTDGGWWSRDPVFIFPQKGKQGHVNLSYESDSVAKSNLGVRKKFLCKNVFNVEQDLEV